jgi:hypothetical protein
MKVVSQINPPCDLNFNKALEAHLASSLASNLKLQNFTIERDSCVVIMALQHPSIVQDWKITDIISDSISFIPASYT